MSEHSSPPARPSDASAKLGYEELMDVPPTRAATGNYRKLFVTPAAIRAENLTPAEVRERINSGYTLKLRRSLYGETPLLAAFLLSLVVIMILLPQNLPEPASVALFALPLTILLAVVHRIYDRVYTVSAEELIITRGHLRFLIRRAPVKFQQVRGIEIAQTLIQRLFKVGDLRVSSAMLDDPEFIMEGIHNPSFYYTVLDLKIKELLDPPASENERHPPPRGATSGGPGADPSPSVLAAHPHRRQ